MRQFTLPNVVKIQKAKSYRAVFIYLYQNSDSSCFFELDADQVGRHLGFSRKQIYRAIAFLKRVNLLKLKLTRRGRGNHSLFWLNWRKSKTKWDISHSISKDFKNHIHDRTIRFNTKWNQKLSAFRQLLQHSWLLPSEQSLCIGVIGRHLKKRSTHYARWLYEALVQTVSVLDAPQWVLTHQDLCRWWMGTIKRLMWNYVPAQSACDGTGI